MSTIEELRQRVESAERRFGLIDEQERRYSERLIGLMNALEAAQGEKQAEAAAHQARIAQLERENGELRSMLHALLLGVEAGSRDMLADTLRDLDSRLSVLLGSGPAADDTVAGQDEPVTAAEIEADDGTVEEMPADDARPGEEIAAEEPMAEEIAAEAPLIEEAVAEEEIPTEEAPAEALSADAPLGDEVELDAVAAAEQAVAALIGDEPAAEDAVMTDEMVADEPHGSEDLLDEIAAEARDAGTASPVAEMIGRLEEETQYFPESEAMEAPAPAVKPVRKKA